MDAADFIFSQPWAMLPDRVVQMIAIAERAMSNSVELDAVLAKAGKPMENTRTVINRDGVAVIPVRGVISRYANLFDAICGGTSVQVLAKDIRTAVDDPEIHAIILEIDSPGGQVAGIGELASQIHEATQVKPVVSYVSNLGASAGYWLASAGSEVVAAPSAILGSVGVVCTLPRTTKDGKTVEFVSSKSPNKRVSTETPDGQAKIQAEVDAMADVFIAAVAEYRELTPEQVVSDFGAGGCLIGQAAVDVGMADRLGSLEQLISELSNGGPAGSSLPIKHGGAADAGFKDQKMKVPFASLFASWVSGGMKETVEVPDAEASANEDAGSMLAKFQASQLNVPAGPTVRELELKAELEALKAAQAKGIQDEATAWFESQVKAEKITPAESAAYVAAYVDASRLDASSPIAGFSRLGSFKAGVESRKPSGVTTESIPTDADSVKAQLEKGGFKTLPHAAATPSEAEAKRDKEILAEMMAAIDADQ